MIPASSSFQKDCGALFVVFPIYDLLYNMETSNYFYFCIFYFVSRGCPGVGNTHFEHFEVFAKKIMSNVISLQLAFCVQ